MNIATKLTAPVSVNLELTEKCNLNCFFCFCPTAEYKENYELVSEELRFVNLKKILTILKENGVMEVRFFGGEFATVRNWKELMQFAKDLDFFISFVSNGTLFTEEDISFIREIGIKECSISLHGLKEVHDTITGSNGSFEKTVKNIQELQKSGVNVAVPFTPNKYNLPEIKKFLTVMAIDYNIKTIGINRLYKGDGKYGSLTLKDYRELFEIMDEVRKEYNLAINFLDSFPRCLIPLKYWKYHAYCSQGVAFAQINYLGQIKNCASLSVKIGNIFEENLKDIWDKRFTEFRKLSHLPLSCRLCPIYCGGGCIASRTMNKNFIADEFLKMPDEEKLLETLRITSKNYMKKWVFQLLAKLEEIKSLKQTEKISVCPTINCRYKIRKEQEGLYIGLFENKGMIFLDQIAINVLGLLDGKHSVAEISKLVGISMEETKEVVKILV